MKKFETILEEHLERVSYDVMEQYSDVLRDMIKGRSGVYALYDRDELYYVGLASNMMARLKNHLRDRHKGLWDRFSVYLTARPEQAHIRELEALLLRIIRPQGNRVGGRLRAAKNLLPSLQRAMSRRDGERRAKMLGGRAAISLEKRRNKSNARKLAASPRLIFLRSTHKDSKYVARLRKDGQVAYAGSLYPSLRAAAKAIVGTRTSMRRSTRARRLSRRPWRLPDERAHHGWHGKPCVPSVHTRLGGGDPASLASPSAMKRSTWRPC